MKRRDFLQHTFASTPILLSASAIEWENSASIQSAVVVNAGIGGNNTRDLLGRIDKDCLSHHPDLTILMIGTNDMNSQKHVPLEEYTANYRKLVDMILKAKSKLLTMSILPVYEPYLLTRHPAEFYAPDGHASRKAKVNEMIRNTANQKKLSFLDMHHIFEKVGTIGLSSMSLLKNEVNSGKTDGVHPTPEGYRLMAVAIYQHIIAHALPANRVVCFGDSITAGDGTIDGQSYPAYLQKLLTN